MSTSSTPAAGSKAPRATKNGTNWSAALCGALVQCFDIGVARFVVDTGNKYPGAFYLPDKSLVKYVAEPGYLWGDIVVRVVIRPKIDGYAVSDTKPYKKQCEATAMINVPRIFGDASSPSDRRYVSVMLMYVSNNFRREWRNASPA